MRISLTGPVADPAAAWSLIGDTEHLNRIGGNPKLTMELVPDAHGFPVLQGDQIGPGGLRMPFEEIDERWVQGRFFVQERRVRGPLLRHTRYEARLEPTPEGGVRPSITLDIDPAHAALGPVVALSTRQLKARWQEALDALPRPGDTPPERRLREIGGAVDAAVRAWRSRGAPEPIVSRLVGHLTTARDADLLELRPLALAAAWGMEGDAVLLSFVSAVGSGVLELYWAVRCPRCQGAVARADVLSNVADHASCPSCRIGFANDLAETVEVLFAAPPGLAPRGTERFCTLFPARRPGTTALAMVQPGERVELPVGLTEGSWRLGAGGGEPDTDVEVAAEGSSGLEWSPRGDAAPVRLRVGDAAIGLSNSGDARLRVTLTRAEADPWRLPASRIATLPEARRAIGPQVLAADIRIAVQHVTLLFTDLSGSTALYEELGDAGAFAFVHEHFRLLDGIVEAHGGVRVKTIGDALMASFHDPLEGLRAAIAMQRAFDPWAEGRGLARPPRLKVGVHAGPALAVHTDSADLDYFGGTVNLAARAQDRAAPGEVVWTAAMYEDLRLWEEVAGLTPEPFTSPIKGLAEPVQLWRISVATVASPS